MSDMSADTIERLVDLTQQGRIEWTPLYPDSFGAPDYTSQELGYMAGLTMPHAYAAHDESFGFGMLMFQLKSPMSEDYDPHLFMLGQELALSDTDLALLRDAITIYLQEVQMGRFANQEQQVGEIIQNAITPYISEIEHLRKLLDKREQQYDRQLGILESLSKAPAHPTAHTRNPNSPPQHHPRPEPAQTMLESGLPLNPTTLRHALRYLLEPDANFDQFVTLERCDAVVQQVLRDLIPPVTPS